MEQLLRYLVTIRYADDPDVSAQAGSVFIIRNAINHYPLQPNVTVNVQCTVIKIQAFPWPLAHHTLLQAIQRNNLNYLSTGKPIYWPSDLNKTSDVLYFIVLKEFSHVFCNMETNLGLSLDHSVYNNIKP